ncbi:MAG TPA: class I SAM-dependent methyltransferase [Acetobacteraceae bacterium]|nr:class I SAM-dependent methyltransferase [Acetobacteraceae bacterium]
MTLFANPSRATRGRSMEGLTAAWYAHLTQHDMPAFAAEAEMIAARLAPGARVLEIAPGPGYLAIALAGHPDVTVEAVDISRSFVQIAQRNAARAGVTVAVRQGDVHALPYGDARFDFVVCRAAFKNFVRPADALREMRRVLAADGEALIVDLRRDVSDAEIDRFVDDYTPSVINRLIMRRTFKGMLRPRAYDAVQFRQMATEAGFSRCHVMQEAISLQVWLGR